MINTRENQDWSISIMDMIDQWIENNNKFKDVFRYSDGSFAYSYGSINGTHKVVDTEFIAPDPLIINVTYQLPVFCAACEETYTSQAELVKAIEVLDEEFDVPEGTELIIKCHLQDENNLQVIVELEDV